MDWQSLVALGALVLSALGLMERMFGKSLPRSEHIEFKERVLSDMEKLEQRISKVEARK